jgi:hypothetical protein
MAAPGAIRTSSVTEGSAMSLRRTEYGNPPRYECRVSIQGERILLGYFSLRSHALKAEQIATTIRQALSRAEVIRRKQAKDFSFPNQNQTEQAA